MGGKSSSMKAEENREEAENMKHDVSKEKDQKSTLRSSTCKELTSIQLKMKEHQINLFKEIHLPGIRWLNRVSFLLEELFVEPLLYDVTKEGTADNTPFNMKEIFKNENNQNPRRLTLEGSPGSGKTTLAIKLLSDWSRKESYMYDRFDLVFAIPARNFDGDIYSCINQQCNIGETDKAIRGAVGELEDRVLLLVDGLDEATSETKMKLLPLLQGKEQPDMTVICTSRSIDSKNEFVNENLATNEEFEIDSYWDKRIVIRGFSEDNKKEFIHKYLNIDFSRVEKLFTKSSLPLLELCESSLFFLLLATVEMEEELEGCNNWTTLFKIILNFIFKRNLEDKNLERADEDESNAFESQSQSALIFQNVLVKFGEMALDKIIGNSLIINKEEIQRLSEADDSIQKLGFLSEQVSFLRWKEKEHYKPMHKSFMEFSAAFYLSTLTEVRLEQEIAHLAAVQLLPIGNVFLYTFLGGLLQKEAHKLFKALLPWKCLITIFKEGVSRILLEIPQTEDILQSLKPFTPTRWPEFPLSTSVGHWFSSVIKHRQPDETLESIRLKLPSDDNESFSSLPDTLVVNKIILDIKKIQPESKDQWGVLKGRKFHCKTLHFNINPGIFENIATFLEILSAFEAEELCLTLMYSRSAPDIEKETAKKEFLAFYNEMVEGNLKNLNIHHLSLLDIHPCNFNSLLSYLKCLIEEKRIENGLSATLFSYNKDNLGNSLDCLEEFFNSVCSSHLKTFIFDHSVGLPLTILPQLSTNEKEWDYVCVSGNYSKEAATAIQTFSAKQFDCLGRYRTHEYAAAKSQLLSACKGVKRLICSDGFIHNIHKEFPSVWGGFESIERIDLFIVEDLSSSWFSNFKNLRHLFLSFYSFFLVDHDGDVLFELVSSLPSLKTITIDNDCVDDVGIFIRFLKKLSKIKEDEPNLNLRLDIMEASLPLAVESLTSFCASIDKCLSKNIVGQCIFRKPIGNMTNRPIIDYFLPKSEFTISSELCDHIASDAILFTDEETAGKNYEKITISSSQEFSDH